MPRIVAFNSSFANVTPQLSVYVTFDVRLMLLGFLCRCVFEKFHDCNLKEGMLPCAKEDERGRKEVVGEIRKFHTEVNNCLTPHQILLEWSNQGELCELVMWHEWRRDVPKGFS